MMPMFMSGKVPIVGAYALAKSSYEPANAMYYAGSCGNKEMAPSGLGHFTERLKLKSPKVVVVYPDVLPRPARQIGAAEGCHQLGAGMPS